MRNIVRNLLVAALAAAASFPAHAAADCAGLHQGRDARGVLAAEDAWVRALIAKDRKTLGCLLAPGFMDMAWNGQMHSRAEVLAALPKRPANGIRLSDVKVALNGGKAVARGINTATKPDGSLLGRVRFEDMFEYRNGYWRALTAQETLIH